MQHTYPGTAVDVAEIDPAVTEANLMATGLPRDTTIQTTWGDARQFVERNQDRKQYDLIFGDAFNDFSVPWHLTTREFNEKIAKMLGPDGVYMINIIDAYESDAKAAERGQARIKKEKITDPEAQARVRREALARATDLRRLPRRLGQDGQAHVPLTSTSSGPTTTPARGSARPSSSSPRRPARRDLADLGGRDDDPRFFQDDRLFEPRPFGKEHQAAIDLRSRGIILTDDYAPVENLLAPVAATRGED